MFIGIHTIMVFSTGLVGNLNHIVFGTDTGSLWALWIYLMAMAVIVVLWLAASPFTLRHPGWCRPSGAPASVGSRL